MKSNINSFTFYFDYYNLIDTLPVNDKQILLVAITDYVFKDIEPNLEGHNQAIFNTLKAQLNVSKNKSKNARKEKQKEIKQKSNENQIEIKQDNKTSILSFIFNNFIFIQNRGLLRGKIEEWINYKEEKKEPYNAYSLKALLNRIEQKVKEYGEEYVINAIDNSMSNGYSGIIYKSIEKEEATPSWFKKEIKKEVLSENEKKEMEKIMEDYK